MKTVVILAAIVFVGLVLIEQISCEKSSGFSFENLVKSYLNFFNIEMNQSETNHIRKKLSHRCIWKICSKPLHSNLIQPEKSIIKSGQKFRFVG